MCDTPEGSVQTFVPYESDKKVLRLYAKWLERFDPRHAAQWGKLCNDNLEAATCEALFWGILGAHDVEVEPNASLDEALPAPDFRCKKNGFEFYLEVTCIQIDTATKRTGLRHPPKPGASHYSLLNGAICHECIQKTKQCASVDAPCVLGIGTFHCHASASCITETFMEWLLTGEESIGVVFDPQLGQIVGEPYPVTELRCATFFNRLRDDAVPSTARSPISAVVVGGFVKPRPNVFGVLHPEPLHEFDRSVLHHIPFCRLRPGYESGKMSSEWS